MALLPFFVRSSVPLALALAACASPSGPSDEDPIVSADDELVETRIAPARDVPPQVIGDSIVFVRSSGEAFEVVKATIRGNIEVLYRPTPAMEHPSMSMHVGMTRGGGTVRVAGRAYFPMTWAESHRRKDGLIETDGTVAGTRVIEGASLPYACGRFVYLGYGGRYDPATRTTKGVPAMAGSVEHAFCAGDSARIYITYPSGPQDRRFYRWDEDGTFAELVLPRLLEYPNHMAAPFGLLGGRVIALWDLWPAPGVAPNEGAGAGHPDFEGITRQKFEREILPAGIVRDATGKERLAFTIGSVAFGTTDGTRAGTHLYRQLVDRWSSVEHIEIVSGKAVGLVAHGLGGRGVFESDGTEAGSVVRATKIDALPTPYPSVEIARRSANEWLVVGVANDGALELVTTDWTIAGTRAVVGSPLRMPGVSHAAFDRWNGYSAIGYVYAQPGGASVLYASHGVQLLRIAIP